jgi:hypothetical protein
MTLHFRVPSTYVNKGCVTMWPCHLYEKAFMAKEELWELKYFAMKKYNLQKIL